MSTREIRIKLGTKIKNLRKKNGWTQFELCERAGVDRSHLSEIETAKAEICLDNLVLIAHAFKMAPWQLLKFNEGSREIKKSD